MKKYVFLFLLSILAYNASSYAQAVDDRAVIPVAVTLNSILRLNVKAGGNIEFKFNTLEQYQTGIGNTSEYDTQISVASSVNWQLTLGAEDGYLINTDTVSASAGAQDMDLDFIGFTVEDDNSSNTSTNNATSVTDLDQITSASPILENGGGEGNAGSAAENSFTIHWECATGTSPVLGPLLGSNLTGGRYATNVFLILEPDTP